ncbi:MAG TPA: hypothetical protein VKV74_17340 [Bryobacteraceae bacterium]|nr:hypothetical protein [Bryobacteraceae bacterium]
MNEKPRSSGILLLAAVCGTFCTAQQVTTVEPSKVIDVRALVRARTLRQDFEFAGLAQSNGRWAVVVDFKTTKTSIIVTGSERESPAFSDYIDGLADRVAMDPSGRIYLRMFPTPGFTEFEIRDSGLREGRRQKLKTAARPEPVSSSAGVFWIEGNIGKELFRVSPGSRIHAGSLERNLAQRAESELAPNVPPLPESRTVLALENGTDAPRWIEVKHVAEEVATFENNGRPLTRNKLELDPAYTAAGFPVPQRNPQDGTMLFRWAAASRSGDLYLCLTSVPVGRPRPIAITDPLTGRLRKILSLVMPTSPERVDQYNPQGFMYPTLDALDDRLVVMDAGIGILGVYAVN